MRTGRTAEGDCLRAHAEWEALAEVHPRRGTPEDGEGEDVEDGEGDKRVTALLVARGQLVGGRTGLREGVVSDEARNERTNGLHDGAGEERLHDRSK